MFNTSLFVWDITKEKVKNKSNLWKFLKIELFSKHKITWTKLLVDLGYLAIVVDIWNIQIKADKSLLFIKIIILTIVLEHEL